MKKLTRQQKLQLAAEAQVDPRTVTRIYDGQSTKEMILERVVAAAKKLGFSTPKEKE
jgi:DNA-binding LacI/PurR family transcriptional regulator